ncbi:type II secretion system protein GspL [Kangiella shandongensis]|uniref:type II secretion system protein GspL n=1 Tax=Kangiella shandongensis TaxID=2763258 RepID=UPI001CC11040|nr:type II secretion system protein GspL [Kangiella shandongensis]
MKQRLFIRVSSDEKSLQWGRLSAEEGQESAGFSEQGQFLVEDAETLGEVVAEEQIILMLPAHRIKCFNVEPPTKNRKHLEKAIPYQLEEQIIDNVDSQHFALGSFDEQGRIAVNVVDKEYLRQLLDLLKEAEVEPDVVVSEAACLPYFKDSWTAVLDEQVLVRQEPNVFWSADKQLVKDLLQLELQSDELTVSQAIRIYSKQHQQLDLDGVPGLATQQEPIEQVFLCLAQNFSNDGVNLLQQEFASQKKTQRNYGVWKLPAIAVSVLLLLGIIYVISNIVYLNHQLTSLEEKTLFETQKIYPSLPLTTARIQINNSYRNVGGDEGSSSSFAGLMDQSIKAINTRDIKFAQLEYIASRGQLSMDVTAESYEVLTQSQRNLESSGLKVDMRNASENGGVWTARISVELNQ